MLTNTPIACYNMSVNEKSSHDRRKKLCPKEARHSKGDVDMKLVVHLSYHKTRNLSREKEGKGERDGRDEADESAKGAAFAR